MRMIPRFHAPRRLSEIILSLKYLTAMAVVKTVLRTARAVQKSLLYLGGAKSTPISAVA